MKVSEVISREVELVSPQDSVQDAARRMKDGDVGALPVGDADKLIGMITDRDIADIVRIGESSAEEALEIITEAGGEHNQ